MWLFYNLQFNSKEHEVFVQLLMFSALENSNATICWPNNAITPLSPFLFPSIWICKTSLSELKHIMFTSHTIDFNVFLLCVRTQSQHDHDNNPTESNNPSGVVFWLLVCFPLSFS